MTPQFEAAWEICNFLQQHQIRHAVIGGIAVQYWGEPRFTHDVDLSIATPLEEGSGPLVELITRHFASRVDNPLDFARQTRMLLIAAPNGIFVDISLALPGYEDDVFKRAIVYTLEANKTIQLCSAEDLIIHKAVAGRPQDITDMEGIILRQKRKLDITYIRDWLTQFAEILGNPEIEARFERLYKK
jgi:predicted nucleotidyltransferase